MKISKFTLKRLEVMTFTTISCVVIAFGCLIAFSMIIDKVGTLEDQMKELSTQTQTTTIKPLIEKYKKYVGKCVGIIYTNANSNQSSRLGVIRGIEKINEKDCIIVIDNKNSLFNYNPQIIPLDTICHIDNTFTTLHIIECSTFVYIAIIIFMFIGFGVFIIGCLYILCKLILPDI